MDEITRAFSRVRPEDFRRTTSALAEQTGVPDSLEEFFVPLVALARWSYEHHDQELVPFAVLASRDVQRLYEWEPDETLHMLAERMRREARLIGANRAFIAMIARYGPEVDPNRLDEALAAGVVREVIACHAQEVVPERFEIGAAIVIDQDGTLGREMSGVRFQPYFHDILPTPGER